MVKNQQGFSVAEFLLVFILLAGILGAGWYVWNSKTNTNKIVSNSAQTATPSSESFTVAAAGDIAVVGGKQAETAKLINEINPDLVLVLGDVQYPNGKLSDYTSAEGYDNSWGNFKAITKPSPGNHDYMQPCAQGYFDYFDPDNSGKFGSECKAYYSFTKGRWLFLSLDSECVSLKDDMNCDSAQQQWVTEEIKAHPGACTAAFWHKPAYTHKGWAEGHGDSESMKPYFNLLLDHKASLVFAGHNHFYSRSYPLGKDGMRDDTHGIVQFIVGSGGNRIYADGGLDSRSIEAARVDAHGVLNVEFEANTYTYSFIDIDGKTHESGQHTGYCEK